MATWGEGDAQELIVAIQRAWKDDPEDMAKLAAYDPAAKSWGFVHYPLEKPAGEGWVGLSEMTALGGDRFALIERDNQSGAAAALKSVTVISLAGVEPKPLGGDLPMVEKSVAIDLLPEMLVTKGWISDKPEGLALLASGELIAVTDNDGVEDATGETLLLRLVWPHVIN